MLGDNGLSVSAPALLPVGCSARCCQEDHVQTVWPLEPAPHLPRASPEALLGAPSLAEDMAEPESLTFCFSALIFLPVKGAGSGCRVQDQRTVTHVLTTHNSLQASEKLLC